MKIQWGHTPQNLAGCVPAKFIYTLMPALPENREPIGFHK